MGKKLQYKTMENVSLLSPFNKFNYDKGMIYTFYMNLFFLYDPQLYV